MSDLKELIDLNLDYVVAQEIRRLHVAMRWELEKPPSAHHKEDRKEYKRLAKAAKTIYNYYTVPEEHLP